MDEADFCFSAMIFTSAVAGITTLLIISGLSISLLCARVRRHDKGGRESARDVVHTLRFHLAPDCLYILDSIKATLIFFLPFQIKQVSQI